MTDTFSQIWSATDVVTLPVQPRRVHDLPWRPVQPAAPGDARVRRAGATDALNGRVGARLPLHRWAEEGSAAIDPDDRPMALLATDDRIVVSGEGPWTIYDHELRRIGAGMRAGGVVTLDPENGLLHAADAAGSLEAHRLADGTSAYALPLMLGADWERRYVARRGQRMIVVSKERPLDPHADLSNLRCMIETCDVGSPLQVGDDGYLESALGQGDLVRATTQLLAAAEGGTIVLATGDYLYWLDLSLDVGAAVEGAFTPVTLSLDETCRVHLVCNTDRGPAYWAVDQDGRRAGEILLSPDFASTPFPPLVTHDHHVFLLSRDKIVAIAPDGRALWERRDSVAGGIVTAGDRLLVSAGSCLRSFGTDGTHTPLFDFGGDELWTAPVLTPDGVLFVASRGRLYRLARAQWS